MTREDQLQERAFEILRLALAIEGRLMLYKDVQRALPDMRDLIAVLRETAQLIDQSYETR